ncbi:MAG: PQQ-binding-like beta-propeller repeat protein [Candidatus Altiarchaeota archaeon]|nr:PQQ-binding-like beta-propeller repeat protein [Candidatus Altiarchaeota archaeon]
MKFKLSILVFLLLMPMVSASNWPMFHHDLKNTGYTTDIAPKTNQTLWTYTTDGAVQSSPAVADGMVFIGSNGEKFDGIVPCSDNRNGRGQRPQSEQSWLQGSGHGRGFCRIGR